MYALFLALAIAQPVQVKSLEPAIPVEVKMMPKEDQLADYMSKTATAAKNRHALAVFVGVPARKVEGMLSVRRDDLPGGPTKGIVVSVPDGKGWMTWAKVRGEYSLDPDASDAEIRRVAGLAVQPSADPFDKTSERLDPPKSARPDARSDDSRGPWLPKKDQEYIRSLWPEGVPLPDALKFYKLPRASQEVSVTNSEVNYNFRYAQGDNVNLRFPYRGSGGLDFVSNNDARNVTGMVLPEGGRIKVWTQRKPILNSFGNHQHEVSLFWKFPPGTQMFDVLIRKNADGTEHIFTIRRRVRGDDGWDDGASFFPDVPTKSEYTLKRDLGDLPTARNIFAMNRMTFAVVETEPINDRKVKFKETKNTIGITDGGHFMPPGFVGAGVTCNKCHGVVSLRASLAADGEQAPYGGPSLAGNDTVYSWYPVLRSDFGSFRPSLDYRWPLE